MAAMRARRMCRATPEDEFKLCFAKECSREQIPLPEDERGRFGFDGAEGHAFHIYKDSSHEELATTIEFTELEDLRAFLKENLPGLFEEQKPAATTLDGATNEPAPETRVANAGEFAAIWNTSTPAEREHIVEVINARADQALDCVVRDHDSLVDNLKKADIVFDSLPGPEGATFIEVEDMSGTSIKLGTWMVRPDGMVALRISGVLS